jgi:hypothetical protein
MSLGKFIITPKLSNNHQILFSMSRGKCKTITGYGWRKWKKKEKEKIGDKEDAQPSNKEREAAMLKKSDTISAKEQN